MTEAEEILTNARAAKERGEITEADLHEIYYMVARAEAEKELEKWHSLDKAN